MKNKHTETGKKRAARKEGNKERNEVYQPKVRLQLMIPYHILMEIEKARKEGESLNLEITNLIIIGLKALEKVSK